MDQCLVSSSMMEARASQGDLLTTMVPMMGSASIYRATRGMNKFLVWLQAHGKTCNLHTVTRAVLNDILKEFYECMLRDRAISRSTMHNLRAGISTMIRAPPYNRDFCLGTDREFHTANQALRDGVKMSFEKGETKQRPVTIDLADVQRLAHYLYAWRTNADRLLHTVWFLLCYYFGFKCRMLWARMTTSSFVILTDTHGRDYLTADPSLQPEKTHPKCPALPRRRIYGEPVDILRFFLTKLHPETKRLFSYPRRRYISGDVWFSKEPVGKNTLGQFMRTISLKAHLSRTYTASSVKGPNIASIFSAQVVGADEEPTIINTIKTQKDGTLPTKISVPQYMNSIRMTEIEHVTDTRQSSTKAEMNSPVQSIKLVSRPVIANTHRHVSNGQTTAFTSSDGMSAGLIDGHVSAVTTWPLGTTADRMPRIACTDAYHNSQMERTQVFRSIQEQLHRQGVITNSQGQLLRGQQTVYNSQGQSLRGHQTVYNSMLAPGRFTEVATCSPTCDPTHGSARECRPYMASCCKVSQPSIVRSETCVFAVSDLSEGQSQTISSTQLDSQLRPMSSYTRRDSGSKAVDIVIIEPRPPGDDDRMTAPQSVPHSTSLDNVACLSEEPGDKSSYPVSLPNGSSLQQHVATLRLIYPWLECDSTVENIDNRTLLYCKPCLDAGINYEIPIFGSNKVIQEHAASDRHLAAVGLQTILCKSIPTRSNAGFPCRSESISYTEGPSLEMVSPKKEDTSTDKEYSVSPQPDDSGNLDLLSSMASEKHDSQMAPLSASYQSEEDMASQGSKEVRIRKFCERWLKQFQWLYFDRTKNLMYCGLCLKHRKQSKHSNSFIKGNGCFKIVSLSSHAGSLDHQMAEQAEKVKKLEKQINPEVTNDTNKQNITARQKFMLKKYLLLFPWLIYRADMEKIICELCDRHTRNTLYLEAKENISYETLVQHARLHLHVVAEETEVNSWSLAWEGMDKYRLLNDVSINDQARKFDDLRRWAPLFNDTSVTITGSETELSIVGDNTKGQPQVKGQTDHLPASGSSHSESSALTSDSPGSAYSYWSSHHRYYVRKKPPLLPAFGVFQSKWLNEFTWLHYDQQLNIMKCRLCEKHKKSLGFARGVKIFSRSYIVGHMSMKKHKEAMLAEGFTVADYPREKKRRRSADQPITIKSEPCSEENNFSDDVGSEDPWSEQSSLPPSSPCPLYMTVSTDCPAITVVTHPIQPKSEPLDPDTSEEHQPDSSQPRIPHSGTPQSYMPRLDPTPPDVSSVDQSPQSDTCNSFSQTPTKKRKRCFFPNWAVQFPWVEYHEDGHYMLCTWCKAHGFNSSFTRGCRTFHIDSLRSHDGSLSHQQAGHMELARQTC